MGYAAFIVGLVVIAGLNSCTALYSPLPAAAPLMEKQGDIVIAGKLSAAGLSGHFAASLTDHIAILGEVYGAGKADTAPIYNEFSGYNFAIGTQKRFDKSFGADLYFGVGKGSSVFEGRNIGIIGMTLDSGGAEFTNYFVQIAAGSNYEFIEVGLQVRLTYISFTNYAEVIEDAGPQGPVPRDTLTDLSNAFVTETGAFFRVGADEMRATASFTYSVVPLQSPRKSHWLNWLNLGVGIQVRLNALELF
jgi:hypothetical protein